MTFKYLETNITSNKNLEEVSTKHSWYPKQLWCLAIYVV
jgi:hypothetical protein